MHRVFLIFTIVHIILMHLIDTDKFINFACFGFLFVVNNTLTMFDLYLDFPIVIFEDENYIKSGFENVMTYIFGVLTVLFCSGFFFSFYLFLKYNELVLFSICLMYITSHLSIIMYFLWDNFVICSGNAYCEYYENINTSKKLKRSFLPSSLSDEAYMLYKENPISI